MLPKTSSVVPALAVLSVFVTPVQADDDAKLSFTPVEMMACKFKEGKTWDNLKPLTEAFNAWLEENDPNYTYWIFTPVFREDNELDYAWIGGWGSGKQFGKSWDNWFADNDGVGAMFNEVAECVNSLSAVTPIHLPSDEWLEEGTAWFQRCSLEGETTLSDAVAGHRGVSQSMQKMGSTGYSWAFLPALGFGDVEFDYYHVESWANYEQLGAGFDGWFNKGGWKTGAEMLSGVDCAS
jgi:hypothetical protein